MPALPFQLYDYSKTLNGYHRAGWFWCIRCEDWIPWDAVFGPSSSAVSPHANDHLTVWWALRAIEWTDYPGEKK